MTLACKIENNRNFSVMHLWNLEVPMSSLIPRFLIGKACLLILAYFATGNIIFADFPLCLTVVVDSKLGTTGEMFLELDEEGLTCSIQMTFFLSSLPFL